MNANLVSTHHFQKNFFTFCFATQGTVYYFDFVNQTINMTNNAYQYIFALDSGSYISVTASGIQSNFQLYNESISYSYSGENGALYSQNLVPNMINFVINSTVFTNCYSNQGSAISVYQIGKLLCY